VKPSKLRTKAGVKRAYILLEFTAGLAIFFAFFVIYLQLKSYIFKQLNKLNTEYKELSSVKNDTYYLFTAKVDELKLDSRYQYTQENGLYQFLIKDNKVLSGLKVNRRAN